MVDNLAEELDYEHEADATEVSDPVDPTEPGAAAATKQEVEQLKKILSLS